MTHKLRLPLVLLLAATLLMALALPGAAQWVSSDGTSSASGSTEFAWVSFSEPAVATVVKGAPGRKLDVNSPAALERSNRVRAQQENYKQWLAKRYPGVEVVTDLQVTANVLGLKLNGATLSQVKGGPGAVNAGASASFRKAMNRGPAVIAAPELWSAGYDGAGIKVGVVDSGIDQNHPFLTDQTLSVPEGFPKGDTRFTTNKIIVAKVFNQFPFYTPEALYESHGTHVSGTIAGVAGTDGPLASGLSGVAPKAWLGNYNVFPGQVESVYDIFLARAIEEAVTDGMDVINVSIGGTAHKGESMIEMTVNGAVDAGVVVAIAAGNEGPGDYTVDSPGTADKAITVAAITNSHMMAGSVSGAALPQPVLATTGDGNGKLTAELTGEYAVYSATDPMALQPLEGSPLAGKIALIERGQITFSEKINNAAAAGAVAVIIYQSAAGGEEPISMATDGVTIPAVMIGRTPGLTLAGWDGDHTVTLTPAHEQDATPDMLADFTSWGPTPNFTLKPDVAAPGVNVYSSVIGGGYEPYNGTSMATPHVAGSAALLRQAHPDWTPADVKAALMGTARPGADQYGAEPLKIGAGIVNLGRALNPAALAFPSSLSFGIVRPVGPQVYGITVTLRNPTTVEQTYSLSDSAGNLSFSASTVTVPAGGEAQVTATVANRGVKGGNGVPEFVQGYVTVAGASDGIRVPYFYAIDYNK